MMVDALEENVMKDILSIGLQKKKKKKRENQHKNPPNTSSDSQFQLECLWISAAGVFPPCPIGG